MRKVTEQIRDAFQNGTARASGNTMTNGSSVYLHGNEIIKRQGERVLITLAGWPTVTTRERLTGITGANIYQRNREQYLGDSIIDETAWYDYETGEKVET